MRFICTIIDLLMPFHLIAPLHRLPYAPEVNYSLSQLWYNAKIATPCKLHQGHDSKNLITTKVSVPLFHFTSSHMQPASPVNQRGPSNYRQQYGLELYAELSKLTQFCKKYTQIVFYSKDSIQLVRLFINTRVYIVRFWFLKVRYKGRAERTCACQRQHAYKSESLNRSSLNDFNEDGRRSDKEDQIIENLSSVSSEGLYPDKIDLPVSGKEAHLQSTSTIKARQIRYHERSNIKQARDPLNKLCNNNWTITFRNRQNSHSKLLITFF